MKSMWVVKGPWGSGGTRSDGEDAGGGSIAGDGGRRSQDRVHF